MSKSRKERRPQAPKRDSGHLSQGGQRGWRGARRSGSARPAPTADDGFRCGHCQRLVGPLPSGGHHRNHCPYCLYSRHVDAERSGDRANPCGGLMQPVGAFQRPNGEHVLVHRCLRCGFERFNRIAADDDFDLVLTLPIVPPRSARPGEMSGTPPAGANGEPPRDAPGGPPGETNAPGK